MVAMNQLKLKMESLAPGELRRLSNLLAETRCGLKKLEHRLVCALSTADSLMQRRATESDVQMLSVGREAQEIRRSLEEMTWRFVGMEIPSEYPEIPPISLTHLLFEDEELFAHLTGKLYAKPIPNPGWMRQLLHLIRTGVANVTPLFAQACYVTKSGMLLAVQDEADVPNVEGPVLPSTECLAGNRVGPHPISGSLDAKDAAVREAGRNEKVELPDDYDVRSDASQSKKRSGDTTAVRKRDILPASSPFGDAADSTGTATKPTKPRASTRTSARRRKGFE